MINTAKLLMLQYDFRPMVPLDEVAKHYLKELNPTELKRKARSASLPFAVSIEGKGKATTYLVPLESLAEWLDAKKQEAINDHRAMHA